MDITPIELNVWRDSLYGRRNRAPVFYNPWSSFAVREASFALQWMATENPGKYYANAQFNDLYHKAIQELDDNKRQQDYYDAVSIMHDDPPGLWVVASPAIVAYRTDKFASFDPMSGPTIYFDEVQLKG
jgi:ABC-type transport system substrate-binding protein